MIVGTPFQVLAPDGGEAKARFTGHMLARLEDNFDVKIADPFDLATASSAGGVIALALGAGLSPGEVSDQFDSLTHPVFPTARRRSLRRIVRPAYSGAALKEALTDVGGSRKHLIIPSRDVAMGAVHVIETPHHPQLSPDWTIPMVNVATATTAPAFFPATVVDGHRPIAGGVWASKPTVVAITEAVLMPGVHLGDTHVLNIGTMDPVGIGVHYERQDHGRLAQWATSVAGLLISASSRSGRRTAEHLVEKGSYQRFDARVPAGCTPSTRSSGPTHRHRRGDRPQDQPDLPADVRRARICVLHAHGRSGSTGQHRIGRNDLMNHNDYFDNFLSNAVNLSKFRLETLEGQVTSVYNALKADPELGPRIIKKIPQGSWAHETIINPVNSREVDADFLLHLREEPDWAYDVQQYSTAVWRVLHNHPTYGSMPHGRKCRCVYVEYANSTHVDIVPYVVLADGRKVIIHRDENRFEDTDPEGFTSWMKEKDKIANRNLRKVIRLMKYLRDHKGSFNGVKSILLTTLLGEQVESYKKVLDVGYYSDVPTTLLHVVTDLNNYLQANFSKPSVPDPSGSGATFDHRWSPETYSNFRKRLNVITAQIKAAYDEEDPDESVKMWQDLFGDKFQPPKTSTSSSKFGTGAAAAGAAVSTSTGRTGRAG